MLRTEKIQSKLKKSFPVPCNEIKGLQDYFSISFWRPFWLSCWFINMQTTMYYISHTWVGLAFLFFFANMLVHFLIYTNIKLCPIHQQPFNDVCIWTPYPKSTYSNTVYALWQFNSRDFKDIIRLDCGLFIFIVHMTLTIFQNPHWNRHPLVYQILAPPQCGNKSRLCQEHHKRNVTTAEIKCQPMTIFICLHASP